MLRSKKDDNDNTSSNLPNISVDGNFNKTAGRDINIREVNFQMNFYEDDLKDIIGDFSNIFDSKVEGKLPDSLKRIDIEEKNRVNDLTPKYFDFINEKFLPYFVQVDNFLKNPINEPYVEIYKDTADDINSIIMAYKCSVDHFDLFFEKLIEHVISKKGDINSKKKKLYRLMFHYMYWNCDIGEKENVKTT